MGLLMGHINERFDGSMDADDAEVENSQWFTVIKNKARKEHNSTLDNFKEQ